MFINLKSITQCITKDIVFIATFSSNNLSHYSALRCCS